MRKLSFKTELNEKTFESNNYLYLDGLKTTICFNKQVIYEAAAFYGSVIFSDLVETFMVELEAYDITTEEENAYRTIFKQMIADIKP